MVLPGHNGRMLQRNSVRSAACALVALLVLSGCGSTETKRPSADDPTTPQPSTSVEVPDGVELTPAGTELEFGETAVVAYEPNPKRSSVLRLSVLSVTKGSIKDLSMYTLDKRAKASVPYYVKVGVKNVGNGDVGNTPVPLWAVDSTNTLVQASTFTNVFQRCPSKALPAGFARNQRTNACLVYLVPRTGNVTAISFRPLQAFAPIEWTGEIKTVAPKGKKKKSGAR